MTITVVYSSLRHKVDVAREQDGRRLRLVIFAPAGMPAARVVAEASRLLSTDDAAELRDALGLDKGGGTR